MGKVTLKGKQKQMRGDAKLLFKVIHVKQNQYSGKEMLKQLGIQPGLPVIVFMGGAAKMNVEDATRLERAIYDGVARAAVELETIVVDGGTDSGTMGLLNAGLRKLNFHGIYIGIAPGSLTHLPNQPRDRLEPLGDMHTHFVLVEGENWGDELKPMYALIEALAEEAPSLGILVNGGKGTENEVEENISDDRKVVILEGSGRLADKISLQLRYPGTFLDTNVENMSMDGDFTIFDIDLDPYKLAKKIKNYLKP
jgi:predicted Rossmann-fold nucleotide-binding protein